MMRRLKEKWGIYSNLQLFIILIVFSITGSLALLVAKPILNYLGVEKESLPIWIFWPLRLLIIFTVYQFMIVIIGTLFGQFRFFWNFEKKMLSRLGFKRLRDAD